MDMYTNLLSDIERLKSEKLKQFSKGILNTKLDVIGLYTKDFRFLVKKYESIDIELIELDKFYELNSFYINIGLKQCKTLNEKVDFIEKNISHIDTWAITDSSYQLFDFKDFDEAMPVIERFINYKHEFLIRYGYLFLFNYVKNPQYFEKITSFFKNSDFYYVVMVEAWVISYLFMFHFEKTFDYLKCADLNLDLKIKSIQKAIDSYRLSKEQKDLLKKLRTELRNSAKK